MTGANEDLSIRSAGCNCLGWVTTGDTFLRGILESTNDSGPDGQDWPASAPCRSYGRYSFRGNVIGFAVDVMFVQAFAMNRLKGSQPHFQSNFADLDSALA